MGFRSWRLLHWHFWNPRYRVSWTMKFKILDKIWKINFLGKGCYFINKVKCNCHSVVILKMLLRIKSTSAYLCPYLLYRVLLYRLNSWKIYWQQHCRCISELRNIRFLFSVTKVSLNWRKFGEKQCGKLNSNRPPHRYEANSEKSKIFASDEYGFNNFFKKDLSLFREHLGF